MLCYTLSKVGHPGIADIRRGLFVNWIKQLGQEESSPMLKVSVLNGLMALIGSERTLIPIQSNASSLEGDLNTDDVIKMASHIVTSGNDLGIQSNSAWMLGHLYLSACAVADTRASDGCYLEMQPKPPSEDPPNDSDSDTGSYEEPCDKRKEAELKPPILPPRSPRVADRRRKLSTKMTYSDADRISYYSDDSGPKYVRDPRTESVTISEQCKVHKRPIFDYDPSTIIQISSQYGSTGRDRKSTLPSVQFQPIKSPTFAPEMFPVRKPGICPPDSLDKEVSEMEEQDRPIEPYFPDKLDDTDIGSDDDCYEEMRLIQPSEDLPNDNDSDTGSYEEICDKRKEEDPKPPSLPPGSPRLDHTRKLSSKMTHGGVDRISPYPNDLGQNFIRSSSTKRVEISTQCQIPQRPVPDNEPSTTIQISSQRGVVASDSPDKQVPMMKDQDRPTEPDFPDTLDDTDISNNGNDGASNTVFSDLSVSQLADILNRQNLEKLAKVCKNNKIDGKFLLEFRDDELQKDPINLNWLEIKKLAWLKDGNIPKV